MTKTKPAAVADGCEWNPGTNRPALEMDDHHRTTRASVIVGSQIDYRLCDDCARLPAFEKKTKRIPISKKGLVKAAP